MRGHRGPQRPKIDEWQAREALNDVGRARKHLSNPQMVKAMRAHLAGMNAALGGPQRPRKPGR
jgi:hypothetical protein